MNHPLPDEWGYSGNGTPQDVLKWAFDTFDNDLVIACSFQYTVLIHMAFELRDNVRLVAVDTGRLPEETYLCAAAIERRFNTRIEWYFPDTRGVQELVREHGYFSFRKDVESRKACCLTRKIEPMKRALQSAKAWVSGVRRDQSAARAKMPYVFTDIAHGDIAKICPLLDWTENDMKDYTRQHRLPYNITAVQNKIIYALILQQLWAFRTPFLSFLTSSPPMLSKR